MVNRRHLDAVLAEYVQYYIGTDIITTWSCDRVPFKNQIGSANDPTELVCRHWSATSSCSR